MSRFKQNQLQQQFLRSEFGFVVLVVSQLLQRSGPSIRVLQTHRLNVLAMQLMCFEVQGISPGCSPKCRFKIWSEREILAFTGLQSLRVRCKLAYLSSSRLV